MPQRALEDALHAQVSDVVIEQEREFAAREAKQPMNETAGHVEHLSLEDNMRDKS